jgi:hypothetical protein
MPLILRQIKNGDVLSRQKIQRIINAKITAFIQNEVIFL